jgi:hypothetical protein
MNIVTGFISNINSRNDRDLSKYIAFGLQLISVEIPATVFIERAIFNTDILPKLATLRGGVGFGAAAVSRGEFVYQCRGGFMNGMRRSFSYERYGNVVFVFFEKTDLFLWPFRSMAGRFALNTGNPTKDTLEYVIVQCQKTEWLAIASQLNNPGSGGAASDKKEYVWIDFGAFHMFHGKIDVFQIELYKMRARVDKRLLMGDKESDRILFARCWDPNHPYGGDIYKDINWSFAGSVFGGGTAAVQKFAVKMREKCFQILRERNTLMWEINIWLLIYRESGGELFSLYPSDHSEIVFRGYT